MTVIKMEVEGERTAKDIFCSHCGKNITREEHIVLEGELPADFFLDSSTLCTGSVERVKIYLCLDCWKKRNGQVSSTNY